MLKRTARFKGLAHKAAFLDHVYAKNVRDIFNIIGRGVSEDLGGPQPEITAVDGFNVQMAGCKPGHGNGLHAHVTVETFLSLSSRWAVRWGDWRTRSCSSSSISSRSRRASCAASRTSARSTAT